MDIFEKYKVEDKCILVSIKFSFQYEKLNANLNELEGLAISYDLTILDKVEFKLSSPNPKLFLNTGNLEKLKELVNLHNAKLVIFNHAISAGQEKNLEKFLDCKIIDRTRLILEIFSKRAKTHEGKLQVELARLQYSSTRLIRGWTHLERQKGGIGVRGGPGETQLELDRRMIREKIKRIQKQLEKVSKKRELSRKSRKKNDIPTVSLVGYTNAGKSTLFNKLTNSNIFVQDLLFATLDPTLRKVKIPSVGNIILSDTVGFIKNLPHDLIDAFKATLEEVVEADLLLHIIDFADINNDEYIEQVNDVLKQINAFDKPIIKVFNKIDKLENFQAKVIKDEKDTEIYISVNEDKGLNLLLDEISNLFLKNFIHKTLVLPPNLSYIRAKLYDLNTVLEEKISSDGNFILDIKILQKDFNKIINISNVDLNEYIQKL